MGYYKGHRVLSPSDTVAWGVLVTNLIKSIRTHVKEEYESKPRLVRFLFPRRILLTLYLKSGKTVQGNFVDASENSEWVSISTRGRRGFWSWRRGEFLCFSIRELEGFACRRCW